LEYDIFEKTISFSVCSTPLNDLYHQQDLFQVSLKSLAKCSSRLMGLSKKSLKKRRGGEAKLYAIVFPMV